MAAEEGLPSRTDFWVVGTSCSGHSQSLLAQGELVADISTFDTRHGDPVLSVLPAHPLWQALS